MVKIPTFESEFKKRTGVTDAFTGFSGTGKTTLSLITALALNCMNRDEDYEPCLECAKLIYQSGIKELHYEYGYKNEDGVNLLKHHWRKFDGQHVYKHGNDLDKWVDDQQLLPFSN